MIDIIGEILHNNRMKTLPELAAYNTVENTFFPLDATQALKAILTSPARFVLVGTQGAQRQALLERLAERAHEQGKKVCLLNLAVVNPSEWKARGDDLFMDCIGSPDGVLLLNCQNHLGDKASSAQLETFNELFDRGNPKVNPGLRIVAVLDWTTLSDLSQISLAFCDRFLARMRLLPETHFGISRWDSPPPEATKVVEIDLEFVGLTRCRQLLLESVATDPETGERSFSPGPLPHLAKQAKPPQVRFKNVDLDKPEVVAFLQSLPGCFPHLKLYRCSPDEKALTAKFSHHTLRTVSIPQIESLSPRSAINNANAHLLFALPKSMVSADGSTRFWTQTPQGYLHKLLEQKPPVPLLITESLDKEVWYKILSYPKPVTIYVKEGVEIPLLFRSGFTPQEGALIPAFPLELATVVTTPDPDALAHELRRHAPDTLVIYISSSYDLGTLICGYDAKKTPQAQSFYRALTTGQPVILLGLGQHLDLAAHLIFLVSSRGWVDIDGEMKPISTKNTQILLTPEESDAEVFALFPRKNVASLPDQKSARRTGSTRPELENFHAALTTQSLIFCHGPAAIEKVEHYLAVIPELKINFMTSLIMTPKTTFVQIAEHVLEWAQRNAAGESGYRLLRINLAHCAPAGFFNFFKGLLESPRQLLLPNGDWFTLQAEHKVIFDGEPTEDFFKKSCTLLQCPSFTPEELEKYFIEPALLLCADLKPTERAEIQRIVLAVHDVLNKFKIEDGLSPAGLAAIFSRFKSYRAILPQPSWQQALSQTLKMLTLQSIADPNQKAAFVAWLRQCMGEAEFLEGKADNFYAELVKTPRFVDTPEIRALAHFYLEVIAETEYWKSREETPSGKVGPVVIGPTCSGKDHIAKLILKQAGKRFYPVNAGTHLDLAMASLKTALTEGAYFIVSELDLWPTEWVNSLLRQISRTKITPGFRLIATINGHTYSSRQAFSRDLLQVYYHRGSLRGSLEYKMADAVRDELISVRDTLENLFPLTPPSERTWVNLVELVENRVAVKEAVGMTYALFFYALDTAKSMVRAPSENRLENILHQFLSLYDSQLTIRFNAAAPPSGEFARIEKVLHIPRPVAHIQAEKVFFDSVLTYIAAARLETPALPAPLMDCLVLLHGMTTVKKNYPTCQALPPYWTERELMLKDGLETYALTLADEDIFETLCVTLIKMSFYLRRSPDYWQDYLVSLRNYRDRDDSVRKIVTAAIQWLLEQLGNLNQWILCPSEARLGLIIERFQQVQESQKKLVIKSTSSDAKKQGFHSSRERDVVPGIFDNVREGELGSSTLSDTYLPLGMIDLNQEGYFIIAQPRYPIDEFFTEEKSAGKLVGEITLNTMHAVEEDSQWRFYLLIPLGTRPKELKLPQGIKSALHWHKEKGFFFMAWDAQSKPMKVLDNVTVSVEEPLAIKAPLMPKLPVTHGSYINIDLIKNQELIELVSEIKRSNKSDLTEQYNLLAKLKKWFEKYIYYLNDQKDLGAKARLQAAYKNPKNFANCVLKEGMGKCTEIALAFSQFVADLFRLSVRIELCHTVTQGKIPKMEHALTQVLFPDKGWVRFDPACREKIPKLSAAPVESMLSFFSAPEREQQPPKKVSESKQCYGERHPILTFYWNEFTQFLDRQFLAQVSAKKLGFTQMQESPSPPGTLNLNTGLFESHRGLGNKMSSQTLVIMTPPVVEVDYIDQHLFDYWFSRKFTIIICLGDNRFVEAQTAEQALDFFRSAAAPSVAGLEEWQRKPWQRDRTYLLLYQPELQRLRENFQKMSQSWIIRKREDWKKQASLNGLIADSKEKAPPEAEYQRRSGDISRFEHYGSLGLRVDACSRGREGYQVIAGRDQQAFTQAHCEALSAIKPREIHVRSSNCPSSVLIKLPTYCEMFIEGLSISQAFINNLIHTNAEIGCLFFSECGFPDQELVLPANKNIKRMAFSRCSGELPHFPAENNLLRVSINSSFRNTGMANRINSFLEKSLQCLLLEIGNENYFNEIIVPRKSHLMVLNLTQEGSQRDSCWNSRLRVENALAIVTGSAAKIEAITRSSLCLLRDSNSFETITPQKVIYTAQSPEEQAVLALTGKTTLVELSAEEQAESYAILRQYIQATLAKLNEHLASALFQDDPLLSAMRETRNLLSKSAEKIPSPATSPQPS